jgi:hypothetical protein
MKKLLLLLILSFFSAQGFAAGCPDGSEPVKSISADGTYFVYNCGNTNTSSSNTSLITEINPVYYSGWKQLSNSMTGLSSHNFQFLNDSTKSRRGNQYQRFELRDGDCGSYTTWDDCANDRQRVEFTAEPFLPPKGKHCIAFSIMLDDSFVTMHPTSTALAQIQQSGGPSGFIEGFKSNPGVLMFHAHEGYYDFDWLYLHGSRTDIKQTDLRFRLLSLDEMKGKWTDISFCLDFAKNNMSLWVNGKRKFNINQPPTGLHLPESIFFKYGIYQSFVTKYKQKYNLDTPIQIVYYDEIRRGSSVEEVDFNINPNLKAID